MKLRYTPIALAEVETLLSELVQRSPQGARNVRSRLGEVIRSIENNPSIGQWTDRPLIRRRLLHPYPYMIFYRVGLDEVIVIGLRHAARDPSSMPG